MFIERKINQTSGVVELWLAQWENEPGKPAKKVLTEKVCDEKAAHSDADGNMAETLAVCWADDRTMGNIAVSSPELLGLFPGKNGTNAILPCDFVEAGKFRNGAIRGWCRTHQKHWGTKADLKALAESGDRLCSSHAQNMNYVVDPFTVDITDKEEIGIWCSMPAALSSEPILERRPRIHVHIRDRGQENKKIDRDFAAISIKYQPKLDLFASDSITRVNITPPAAFEFVKGLELGRKMDCINCNACGFPHLDMGDFADKPHKKHFCANCGRDSTWSKEPIVSTPLKPLHDRLAKCHDTISPDREINLDDYAGCNYRIWASTPAVLWTADRPQEMGIHVHINDGTTRVVDNTFSAVRFKGQKLSRKKLITRMIDRTL